MKKEDCINIIELHNKLLDLNVELCDLTPGWEIHGLKEIIDYFYYDRLGFCACGTPDDTKEVIRRLLNIRSDFHNRTINTYNECVNRYETDLNLDIRNNYIHYGLLQFLLYTLDFQGIVEHGSGIGGCWLTEKGKIFRDALNLRSKYKDEYEEVEI